MRNTGISLCWTRFAMPDSIGFRHFVPTLQYKSNPSSGDIGFSPLTALPVSLLLTRILFLLRQPGIGIQANHKSTFQTKILHTHKYAGETTFEAQHGSIAAVIFILFFRFRSLLFERLSCPISRWRSSGIFISSHT